MKSMHNLRVSEQMLTAAQAHTHTQQPEQANTGYIVFITSY